MKDLNSLKEKFPFISLIKCQNKEFVGIIQNCDDKIISFYDFNALKSEDERKSLIELGDIWWWESNRCLPLNIFLNAQMKSFRHCLKTITAKDVEIVFGPKTSLNNLMKKRIKKRQIQLIKKI